MSAPVLEGVVSEFDAVIGWGSLQIQSTGDVLGFHCLDLADGSRMIEVGAAVTCRRVGRLGHWQATEIRRRPSQGSGT